VDWPRASGRARGRCRAGVMRTRAARRRRGAQRRWLEVVEEAYPESSRCSTGSARERVVDESAREPQEEDEATTRSACSPLELLLPLRRACCAPSCAAVPPSRPLYAQAQPWRLVLLLLLVPRPAPAPPRQALGIAGSASPRPPQDLKVQPGSERAHSSGRGQGGWLPQVRLFPSGPPHPALAQQADPFSLAHSHTIDLILLIPRRPTFDAPSSLAEAAEGLTTRPRARLAAPRGVFRRT